jgi:hypothetical protein
MRAGFGLPGPADYGLPNRARWKQLGFITKAPCFVSETLLQRFGWFEEIASLHG